MGVARPKNYFGKKYSPREEIIYSNRIPRNVIIVLIARDEAECNKHDNNCTRCSRVNYFNNRMPRNPIPLL